jgi:hypothetical protein
MNKSLKSSAKDPTVLDSLRKLRSPNGSESQIHKAFALAADVFLTL